MISALLSLLGACASPKPPSIADLRFPVLVMHHVGARSVEVNAESLQTMRVPLAMQADPPPVLIDSDLKIYRMNKVQSTHGGLWMMANPNALTPITFTLEAAGAGKAAARQAIVGLLGVEFSDADEKRLKAFEASGGSFEELAH